MGALLLAISGCSALIYEIVWLQQLELVIGSTAVSVGVLLAAFLGGLCAGSLVLPKCAPASMSPFKVYAALECGTALCAGLVFAELPVLSRLYSAWGGFGPASVALRALVVSICLVPPTALMGATLPALSRVIPAGAQGASRVGLFYAANTFGAVAGCLIAGFYLLRVRDMTTTLLVAISLNALLAVIAILVPDSNRGGGGVSEPEVQVAQAGGRSWPSLIVILLSGFSAIGGEVVWTRLLALLIGPTVYAFSIILAVYLIGIAIGGWIGAQVVRASVRPLRALGVTQGMLALATAWGAYQVNSSMPYWPVAPGLSASPWAVFQLDFVRCLWALLPATILWGSSFPLAVAAMPPDRNQARAVAYVYAANTLGAITGALVFTFLIIPLFGSQAAQRAMLLVSVAACVIALLTVALAPGRASSPVVEWGLVLIFATVGIPLATGISSVPPELVAFGRSLAYRLGLQDPRTGARVTLPRILYSGEGMNESVAVSDDGRVRLFHVAGKIEASTAPKDMRLQRLLGLIPAVTSGQPRSVLIVGFGAGVTAGTFTDCPTIKRIVICELEPLIPKRVATYFSDANHNVASDPRTQIVYDDARHFLLTTKEHFDIITSDPIHPWVKGSAALYSREYFRLVRQHLNPGGVVSQWVPLYQSSAGTVRSELGTFMNVFPEGTVWANLENGRGYDLVVMGGTGRPAIDLDAVAARLAGHEYTNLARSMQEVGHSSWVDLLYTYAGRGRDLAPWLSGATLNEDRNLRLQYQAGMESLVEQEADIYSEIERFRTFPRDLFVGSEQHVDSLLARGAR